MEINIVAHCRLNPAVRVKGIRQPEVFDTAGKRIIQLPCPEAVCFGLNRRENTKDQFDFPNYRRFCRDLFLPYADMIEMLAEEGHTIRITGVPKSPSCGALTVSVGGKVGKDVPFEDRTQSGRGIFFEEIEKELNRRGVFFAMTE